MQSSALALALVIHTAAAAAWPQAESPLQAPVLVSKPSARPWRIYLDAGHGAPGTLDWEEAARWKEPRTLEAFADALAVALDAFLSQ